MPAKAALEDLPTPYRIPRATIAFVALFGVLLPAVALLFESVTGMCRQIFFDPLPTPIHFALYATIPVANVRLLRALMRCEALPPGWGLLHTFSAGVAVFYSLVFLPISPIAAIGIIAFGIGLFGLSPMFAVACVFLARNSLRNGSGKAPGKLWRGMALACLALLALDAPSTLTRIGMQMAASDSAETQLRGIQLLRKAGDEDLMLRLCYQQGGQATDLLGTLFASRTESDPQQARTTFYQVTGTVFNSHPAPPRRSMREWERTFDDDLGGANVGQRVNDVALVASRMDGSIDTDAALGYMEWTMEFHNKSPSQQEGRAQVVLPPGAVVSRATLWIDGEEREAAFGGRAQVREAYAKVVSQRRDPLLVTTAGNDRILVQMFPIPPSGDMKIRLGITIPMAPPGQGAMHLQLPAFSERNFDLAAELRHAIWFESTAPLKGSPGLIAQAGPRGLYAVRGQLQEPMPAQPMHTVWAPGARPAPLAWSTDDKSADGKVVVQVSSEAAAMPPQRVAVVIDGSSSMQQRKRQLLDALASFPKNTELAVVFAGDQTPSLFLHDGSNSLPTREYLAQLDFAGGRDNSDALGAAWDWAGMSSRGAIVWIHGAQPLASRSAAALRQRFERRANQVAVYELAVERGPNEIAQQLKGVHAVPSFGNLREDLDKLFAQWQPGAAQTVMLRERRSGDGLAQSSRTSPHLARLWAADEVAAMSLDPGRSAAAIALATRYQLVTSVSGAVVLETREQYKDAGLEPVPPGSVPTIPEPETWAMILVATLMLAWYRRFRTQ
ncbi:PEP-CTERM protein-sorting domain-containing protein [Duganella sp. CF458]|uniref:VIT domain-containing protein n=1 Tax=Duganella sp. CF458 TaxID=1884368 RepID=UPI0008DF0889|nr:VIT domain-containing protein [Duganella sp. CF458]SFF51491.1 PEP-CTERM protein-sorting domain-containing protein [Duganella sp. CF458]